MRDFINENNLDFTEGSRNSTCVILIGYAQHKKLTLPQFREELKKEIKADKFIGTEINRLWNYCADRNYKKFWSSKEAKTQYTF
ncbi:hypothetical protein MEO93_28080 [Dolichospermum sp. ST_sed3]|nr:hypothetical protein [Dolichospermum sp. ST_sed3]